MYERLRRQLPPTNFGVDRNIEYGYFGHGDILIAAWSGDIKQRPEHDDPRLKLFNMSYGSDTTLIACIAGYLRRAGVTDDKVKEIIINSGSEIIAEKGEQASKGSRHYSWRSRVVKGEAFPTFDIVNEGLEALLPPVPNQPGVVSEVGGTGVYTRRNLFRVSFVLAGVTDTRSIESSRVAEFCVEDISTMATLVCRNALGEYRTEIGELIQQEFLDGSSNSDR
jgi:hypothetical protein